MNIIKKIIILRDMEIYTYNRMSSTRRITAGTVPGGGNTRRQSNLYRLKRGKTKAVYLTDFKFKSIIFPLVKTNL